MVSPARWKIAITNGKIKVEQRDELLIKFLLKLGETMYRENELDLAQGLVKQASLIDLDTCKKVIKAKGFQSWAKI